MNTLLYLLYMLKHKWYVFVECCKLGVPIRGIMHDANKFLPSEWKPYAKRFHEKHVLRAKPQDNFKVGFLFHMKRSKHHWQYWLYNKDGNRIFEVMTPEQVKALDREIDSGYTKDLCTKLYEEVYPMPMPDKYRREMLADWQGASKALKGLNAIKWYEKNKDNMILHPETREWIENYIKRS